MPSLPLSDDIGKNSWSKIHGFWGSKATIKKDQNILLSNSHHFSHHQFHLFLGKIHKLPFVCRDVPFHVGHMHRYHALVNSGRPGLLKAKQQMMVWERQTPSWCPLFQGKNQEIYDIQYVYKIGLGKKQCCWKSYFGLVGIGSCHLFWVVVELMPKWIWLDFTQNNQLQTFLISWSASVQSAHTSNQNPKGYKIYTENNLNNSKFKLQSQLCSWWFHNPIGKYALQIESFSISPTSWSKKTTSWNETTNLFHPQEIKVPSCR